MNLISVENLSKAYGEKIIFDNLTFGIDDTDKCHNGKVIKRIPGK